MAYERVNWENLPSTKTPVNADNLNKMDKGIRDLETELSKKANSADVYTKTEIDEKVTTLYENPSGSTGDLVLSDSRENYDYIKVFVDFGEYVTSAETNTNKICISGLTLNEDGIYTKSVILSFNGINCTKVSNYSSVNRANEYNRYETDTHKVIKILGINKKE